MEHEFKRSEQAMGIQEKKQQSAFEAWLSHSASKLFGTDAEERTPCIAVHVPTSGRYNGEDLAGSVALAYFSNGDAREDIESGDGMVGTFEGDENVFLSSKGARELAEILNRAADAADLHPKASTTRPNTRHSVRCDACDEVMRDGDQVEWFASRQEAVAKASERGWRCDDGDVFCDECITDYASAEAVKGES
jgi:hypothetical protein